MLEVVSVVVVFVAGVFVGAGSWQMVRTRLAVAYATAMTDIKWLEAKVANSQATSAPTTTTPAPPAVG